ncbi:MAG: hypothetical protein ACT4P7_21190 [Gemmatimonadaceae bacterium]
MVNATAGVHNEHAPRPRNVLPAWGWLLLLIVGQAASLSLIDAGNRVSYQHYRLVPGGAVTSIAVGVLVLQAVLVVMSLRHMWTPLRTWLDRNLSPTARLLLVGAVFATSATASKDFGLYAAELVVATVIQVLAIGNAVLLGHSVDAAKMTARLRRWLGPLDAGSQPRIADGFALACALWVLIAGALLAVFSYQRHPHVPDEVVYLLQARYFADGTLTMPLPPAPSAFNVDLMHYDTTRWYSSVPPGWPGALAVGVWLGVPWLVNPVLGALNVVLAHAVLSSMYQRRVARLATLFLAASPWFVFMSMNFMTHQVTLFCALIGALAVARARRDRVRAGPVRGSTLAYTFLGGVTIGLASLVRPLEGLATALLLGLWSLPPRWWAHLGRVTSFVPSVVLAIGAAAGGALVRPYNRHITGDAGYFPIMAYVDKYYAQGSNDLGFGANRGLGWSGLDPYPGHGPIDVVVNANLNVTTTNVELLGWATGSLLAIFLLFALRRMQRPDWWHATVLGVIIGIHTFYWFSGGPDFGARYWYLIIVSCAALAARGVVELGNSLTSGTDVPSTRELAQARATSVALALTLSVLVTFIPWRAIDKYYHYRNMRPDVRELARELRFGRSLVFVRGRRHPDYASATAYNPLDLQADAPLYAWDASPAARAEALRAYPDRPVYFLDGPTITGDRFRVAAGPMTAEQALKFGTP